MSGTRAIGQADSGLECESLIKKIVQGVESGLIGMYLKGAALGGRVLLLMGVG